MKSMLSIDSLYHFAEVLSFDLIVWFGFFFKTAEFKLSFG